jgi:hypothetical protein
MNKLLSFLFLAAIVTGASCKKGNEEGVLVPEELAHFANQSSGSYQVLSAATIYKIPIGVTTVSGSDRTVSFTVTSPTGAVQGTHYTLSKTSATIVAGKATDTIEVRGIPAQYTAGRKDTLVFTISGAGVKSAGFNNTFRLAMRGPCFEGDVDLNAIRGAYTRTNETFGASPYGPYTTTISAATSTSATTARITVTNIWDNGWGPIQFDLDWTDPANRTATVVAQAAVPGSNAGDLSSTYAGQTVAVRPFAGQPGTFSVCNGTLTLRMQLGVTGVGFFGSLYTVNMAR